MSLPRSSLDFQKNDTSHENISLLLSCSQKSSGLLTTDTEAIVMEALWEAWGLEMTSLWSSCFVAYSKF